MVLSAVKIDRIGSKILLFATSLVVKVPAILAFSGPALATLRSTTLVGNLQQRGSRFLG